MITTAKLFKPTKKNITWRHIKYSTASNGTTNSTPSNKVVIVNGGNGALGKHLCKSFSQNYHTISIDISKNSDVESVVLTGAHDKDFAAVESAIGKRELVAILSVAGGWAGGGITANDIFTSTQKMWEVNVNSSVFASYIASKFLVKDGLLVLTGSAAALEPTPDMLGYGIAKKAIHHLVESLAADDAVEFNVVGILPKILDTEANRPYFKDTSVLTPLPYLSQVRCSTVTLILSW
eukprot:TRINITY_DN5493_c0_g1_i2.p1 TRINITY_DN5493_c0_g1~~TRINITY_DN5493_c0_g1_i2.p1  ORF type:complete len:236 (+),score=49.27 TRINITY_DN5493_c0_g1_i2:122-829(+)